MTSVRALPTLIEEQLGRFDILLLNAGTVALAPIDQTDEATYDRMMNVNGLSSSFGARGIRGQIQHHLRRQWA